MAVNFNLIKPTPSPRTGEVARGSFSTSTLRAPNRGFLADLLQGYNSAKQNKVLQQQARQASQLQQLKLQQAQQNLDVSKELAPIQIEQQKQKIKVAKQQVHNAILQGQSLGEEVTQKSLKTYIQKQQILGQLALNIESMPKQRREQRYKELLPAIQKIIPNAPNKYDSTLTQGALALAMPVAQQMKDNPDLKAMAFPEEVRQYIKETLVLQPKGKLTKLEELEEGKKRALAQNNTRLLKLLDQQQTKLAQSGGGSNVTVNVDTGDKIKPLSSKTVPVIEDKLIQARDDLNSLQKISDTFDEQAFTYQGKWNEFVAEIADRLNLSSTQQKRLLNRRTKQMQNIMAMALIWRKYITGVAGGEREMEEIIKTTLNKDQSPEQARASLNRLMEKTQRDIEVRSRLLEKGITVGNTDEVTYTRQFKAERAQIEAKAAVEKLDTEVVKKETEQQREFSEEDISRIKSLSNEEITQLEKRARARGVSDKDIKAKTKQLLEIRDENSEVSIQAGAFKALEFQPNIAHIHKVKKEMREPLQQILQELEDKGWEPIIQNSTRTVKEQREKVRKGYSKTMRSKHLTGQAVDIVDRRYMWGKEAADKNFQFWKDLEEAVDNAGLFSGAKWKMKDVAHVQETR